MKILEPHLNEGALIVADNVISHKHVLEDYLYYVANDKKYLDMYKNSGLLNTIYPMDNLSVGDVPEKAYNDRFLTSAWIMKDKSLDQVKFALMSAGWEPREVEDIAHLIGMYQAERNNYPQASTHCGLSDNKVNKWRKIYSSSAW